MDVITKIGIRQHVIIRMVWSGPQDQWRWLENLGFLGLKQMVSTVGPTWFVYLTKDNSDAQLPLLFGHSNNDNPSFDSHTQSLWLMGKSY